MVNNRKTHFNLSILRTWQCETTMLLVIQSCFFQEAYELKGLNEEVVHRDAEASHKRWMSSGKKSRTENHSFFLLLFLHITYTGCPQKIYVLFRQILALYFFQNLPDALVALPNSGGLPLSKFVKDLVASPNSGDLPLSKFTKDFFALPLVRYRCSGYESGIIAWIRIRIFFSNFSGFPDLDPESGN